MKKLKVYIILFLCTFFIVGCENPREESKNEYITMRGMLLEETSYTNNNDLPVDITVKIDRLDQERVKYKVLLDNPKENMHQIKAMVVHNYYSEDLFPSIGVFDETGELLTSSEGSNIKLEDIIKTTKNISKLKFELKLWLQYTNDLGEKKEMFYKPA